MHPHFEFIENEGNLMLSTVSMQDVADATHALIGLAFIHVKDGYTDWLWRGRHPAKLQNRRQIFHYPKTRLSSATTCSRNCRSVSSKSLYFSLSTSSTATTSRLRTTGITISDTERLLQAMCPGK